MRTIVLPLLAILALPACSSADSPATTTTTGAGGGATGSSSATTGSSTSSSATTGTGGATPGGAPIDAPDSTWTWIPFPDSFCADGSTTGIGVNLSKKSSRVMVYLEGGGACWSELTCYTAKTAANFESGYGETSFASDTAGALGQAGGFFDRSAADNPFKDYSYVYVPYCTGDVHAGSNTVTYGTHTAKHVGFDNMAAYLKRVVPTFPSADRVYLAGSSAGGFGALFNWWQTQQAFGKVRVDLIDDSGTPMPPAIDAMGNGAGPTESKQWNLPATLPAGCTDCAKGLDALFGFYAKAFPNNHGALLSYTKDTVLSQFSGITTDQFNTGLEQDLTTYFAPNPNLKSFLVDKSSHVLFFNPMLATKGVTLNQFLTQMVNDDQAWASVHP
jgi:hypothetical protein